ncbi:MAG: type II toxin-antitoxin system ParD family antitoxin [Planctomycetes bacterium]|nr:type II toxin-antitoxin system ParD family antitoxin [Planctomycetota bacterium]
MHSEPRDDYVLHLSLPTDLESFVEETSRAAGVAPEEFVRRLIREDRERRSEQERLEALLLEGLNSGPGIEFSSESWRAKCREWDEQRRQRGAS